MDVMSIGGYFAFCRANGINLTPDQQWAIAWLIARGQRVFVDFGFKTAVTRAAADLRVHPPAIH